MEKQNILIIDHDPRVLSTIAGFLSDEPYDVFTAENGIAGLEILRREHIHLVVADRGAEEHDGITLLKGVKAENIQTPVLIMGKVAPMELTEEIIRAGAVSVVNKPVEKNRFLAKVKTHIPSGSSWKIAFESFLEAHYNNPDLEFSDLVDHFKRSRTHLSALFKKHVGKPFRENLFFIPRMIWYAVSFWRKDEKNKRLARLYYERVVPVLNRYFDYVLIHGDPRLFQLESFFPWIENIEIPIEYTGYVSEKLESEDFDTKKTIDEQGLMF